MNTTVVRSRIDQKLKQDASKVLGDLGLNLSDAIRMFMTQVVMTQGLPFPVVKTPKAELLEAMRELDAGGGKRFSTVQDLMRDLEDDGDDPD